MVVVIEVSSMKTRHDVSSRACCRIQCRRARATSARSCSAARRAVTPRSSHLSLPFGLRRTPTRRALWLHREKFFHMAKMPVPDLTERHGDLELQVRYTGIRAGAASGRALLVIIGAAPSGSCPGIKPRDPERPCRAVVCAMLRRAAAGAEWPQGLAR